MENIDGAEGADGITILGDSRLDANMIEELAKRRVRVVATRTIGYDHIDLNAAKSNGIHVCNGYYDPDGVAEYTVMLMLMARGITSRHCSAPMPTTIPWVD